MPGGSTPQQQSQQSNTNQSQTQNTTSTTGVNPYIAPFLQNGVGALNDYYNANPTAPGYYPNSTIAPASAATQAATGALYARGANGSPLQSTGNSFAQSVLDPNYLNVGNDPNFQASLAAGFEPQNQQFTNVIAPSLRAQFEGSGRNLGGADMSNVNQALLGLQQGQSNASAQAVEQAYNQRMQNQFNVLNNWIPTSQNMDYQNIGAMGAAGASADQANQAAINANVARYNYGTTAQPNYISDFLSRVQAGYPGGQTTGSGSSNSNGSSFSSGYNTPASNSASSFLGGGLGIAGLALQALPLIPGISDARAKDIRGRVGETSEGLPLYLYTYKGDNDPRIGPVAQEVAKIHPEAVGRHPSGYLTVDYAKATPPGGLL